MRASLGRGSSPAEWMQVNYLSGSIPSELLHAWEAAHSSSPGMHLPPRNSFISDGRVDADLHIPERMPETGSSVGESQRTESVAWERVTVLEEPRITVDYKLNTAFRAPRSSVSIALNSYFLYESMTAYNSAALLLECLRHTLQEVVSQAEEAGFDVEVCIENDGWGCASTVVKVTGYSDKLSLVVESICKV